MNYTQRFLGIRASNISWVGMRPDGNRMDGGRPMEGYLVGSKIVFRSSATWLIADQIKRFRSNQCWGLKSEFTTTVSELCIKTFYVLERFQDQDESQSFGYNGSTAGYLIITLLSLSKLYFYDIREKMFKTGQNLSKIGHFLCKNVQLGCPPTFC